MAAVVDAELPDSELVVNNVLLFWCQQERRSLQKMIRCVCGCLGVTTFIAILNTRWSSASKRHSSCLCSAW